ncbi:MAG: SURF1 family cytochrome oxidase biogenesis protein [Actinomycetota bacterium]|nr:SURF1 family cytochrome oxidase biogenesis protein [Actinomycetota bacterium]
MLALLRTRRWISFTILVVVVIAAFGLLSRWQWSRAEFKKQERLQLETAAVVNPSALPDDSQLQRSSEWSRYTSRGEFDADHQVVVRKRPLNGTNGFWVLTPFTTERGTTIWVNRGWFAATGAATVMPPIPQAPAGAQSIVGDWRFFESASVADLQGLPAGMVPSVAPEVLPINQSAPGYLQLVSPKQAGLTLLSAPQIDEGQNISYAVQWLLFAAVGMIGWFIFLRREAREDSLAQESVTTSS